MISYQFAYRRAKSLAEAQALFAKSPEAKFLAGGQTLIPTMKMRLASPPELIDISGLPELNFVRADDQTLTIGAGTRHHDVAVSGEVWRTIPALSQLAEGIGDPAVRHMGTLGGSLANNDPAADYPAAALALGAAIKTTRRTIAADDFFVGMFATALEDGEIIERQQTGFERFSDAAAVVELGDDLGNTDHMVTEGLIRAMYGPYRAAMGLQ